MQLQAQPPSAQQAYIPMSIPEDFPVYRIMSGKLYADDQLYEAGEVIRWDDEPNLEMEPLNKLARAKALSYRKKLDECGAAVAAKTGNSYAGLASAFQHATDFMSQEGRRINAPQQVPILGGKVKGKKVTRLDTMGESVPVSANKHSLNTPKELNDAFQGKKDGKEA